MTRRRDAFLPLMMLPAGLFVLAVGAWPLLRGMGYSLWHYDLQRPHRMRFAGLANYTDIWADPSDRSALRNTVVFAASAVGIETVLGLGLALLLWRAGRATRAAMALLLVPVAITPLAVGLVFRALLNVDFGIVGYWARVAGIGGPHGLLAGPATALPMLIAIDAWQWTPLMALILATGLKAIPQEIIEAAAIDGARGPALLRRIVLPLLLPALLVAAMIRTMDALRVFDIVFATTQGGPGDATTTLMLEAVKQAFTFFDVGAASTLSAVLMAAIAVVVGGLVLLHGVAERRAS